ncbi:UNVERIFIED_CONTAM: protein MICRORCHIDIA 6, partial [Sesamum radiatum]
LEYFISDIAVLYLLMHFMCCIFTAVAELLDNSVDEGSVITTIGFLKEAPAVNIHGFNVYHKNRLILPFWHVVTYSDSRGRGVVATSGIPVTSSHRNSQGAPLKRKANDGVGPERVKKMVATKSTTVDGAHGGNVQHAVDPAKQLEGQEAANLIQENQKLRAQCQEYEKMDEELNAKITRLMTEVREAHREHARLLLESKLLEKVKQEHRQIKPV